MMVRRRKPPNEPADPRGGRRLGTQGRAYPNRTDLMRQPVRSAGGQEYGARAAQEAAQRAVPMAGAPAPPAAPPGGGAGPGGPPPMGPPVTPDDIPTPGQSPTMRPNEPITAGMPFGPGPGPEVLSAGRDSVGERLRALYLAFPTNELRELITEHEMGMQQNQPLI